MPSCSLPCALGCEKNIGSFRGIARQPPNSCGADCAQPLPCGHPCTLKCHPGRCMSCKVCPPSQPESLIPYRARLAQSGPIRDVERGRREPGGLIQGVEFGRREPRLPGSTSRIGWPSSLHGHDHHEPRRSPISGAISRVRRPSRVPPDISRSLPQLFAHIFGHSLVPLILLFLSVYFLSSVIVEPYNYRQIAHDSKIVAGVWFVVGFIGAVCSYKNIKCIKYIHEFVGILEGHLARSSDTHMLYSLSIGCIFCWKFTTFISKLVWIFGPFIRYVIDPLDNQGQCIPCIPAFALYPMAWHSSRYSQNRQYQNIDKCLHVYPLVEEPLVFISYSNMKDLKGFHNREHCTSFGE